jgi:hypothetical protein
MANIIKDKVKGVVKEVLEEEKKAQSDPARAQLSPEQQKANKAVVACLGTKNVCLQTQRYCLTKGGKLVDPTFINQLQDCAAVCDLTANAVLRESALKSDLAKLCNQTCQTTVKACEQFKDDPQVQMCTQYAQASAQSCQEI